jgi:hypothetical protein
MCVYITNPVPLNIYTTDFQNKIALVYLIMNRNEDYPSSMWNSQQQCTNSPRNRYEYSARVAT